MKALFSLYSPSFCRAIIYMLQSSEYRIGPYLLWFWRTQDFSKVAYRRTLDRTAAARSLLMVLTVGMYAQILLGVSLMIVGYTEELSELYYFGLGIGLFAPLLWAHLIIIFVLLAKLFVMAPQEARHAQVAKAALGTHQAAKIAVAGSYGKTTMKELLLTVLNEGKKTVATPANKNVTSSHAAFAKRLKGDEDIVIVEYGEGKPGDVSKMNEYVQPTHVVITGIAPAHLDRYKTLDAAARDIFSAASGVKPAQVFVNADSTDAEPYMEPNQQTYDHEGALGWKVSQVKLAVTGMTFTLNKGKKKLKLHTGLVGEHLLGPVTLAAALGLELGLTEAQITRGIAKTKPHEHRMQPYALNGAWIIDDSYNGNLEGVRAGTALLAKLPAKRKLYVTPGLVDQGKLTKEVHLQVGQLIARAKPDVVVLIQNSATKHIQEGLEFAGYKGAVQIEKQPLEFYSNLTHILAKDDLLLMQNDWTDNYT